MIHRDTCGLRALHRNCKSSYCCIPTLVDTLMHENGALHRHTKRTLEELGSADGKILGLSMSSSWWYEAKISVDSDVHHIPPSPPCLNPISFMSSTRLHIALDSPLQRRRVRSNNLRNLLAVFEKQESGHSADLQLLRHIRDLVDVDLVETGVGVFVREP